jgi:hypothetical protein
MKERKGNVTNSESMELCTTTRHRESFSRHKKRQSQKIHVASYVQVVPTLGKGIEGSAAGCGRHFRRKVTACNGTTPCPCESLQSKYHFVDRPAYYSNERDSTNKKAIIDPFSERRPTGAEREVGERNEREREQGGESLPLVLVLKATVWYVLLW